MIGKPAAFPKSIHCAIQYASQLAARFIARRIVQKNNCSRRKNLWHRKPSFDQINEDKNTTHIFGKGLQRRVNIGAVDRAVIKERHGPQLLGWAGCYANARPNKHQHSRSAPLSKARRSSVLHKQNLRQPNTQSLHQNQIRSLPPH